MKHLTGIVPLIFQAKILICNKITFSESNSPNLTEPVTNEPAKSIYKKNLPVFLFLFDLSLFKLNIQELITKELNNVMKIIISIVID